MRRLIGIAALVAIVVGLANYERPKTKLDREVDRLCAIDGGVHIYEAVTLAKENFGPNGEVFPQYRHLFLEGKHLGPDYYAISGTVVLRPAPPGRCNRFPVWTVSGLRGSLLGDFAADKIELVIGGDGRLILEEPRWRGLDVSRSPLDGHWVAVDIDSLQARRASFQPSTAPSPDEPLVAPANLRLPLTLKIAKLALGEFSMPALGDKPVQNLQGRIELGADAGALHRIDLQQVEWDQVRASGTLQIGSDAPLELNTSLR